MRKSLAVLVVALSLVGCGEIQERPCPFPNGSIVVHKLSGCKGQVTGRIFSYYEVRFPLYIQTPEGAVVSSLNTIVMDEFEIELAPPTPSKEQAR